jgi:cell division protein FtsB
MLRNIFRFLIPKLFVIVSLVLAFWIGSVTLKEMDRGKRIQEEIASLHAEAQKTQKENTIFQEKIKYFQTDAFQEQEARNKLNYQSPDEKEVVIKPSVHDENTKAPDSAPIPSKIQEFLPNYEKWWQQFFSA